MKQHILVPATISDKFIPFLYKQFSGIEAKYGNRKVKAVVLTNESTLGRFLRLNCEKTPYPIYKDKIGIYFALSEGKVKSNIYTCKNGKSSFLYLPDEALSLFNDLISEIFYIVFITHVDSYVRARNFQTNKKNFVSEAVSIFMEDYNLDEYKEFKHGSLRRYYYRYYETPKFNKLSKKTSLKSKI